MTHPVIHDSLRHGINTVAQMQKAIMSEETKPDNPPAFPFDNHLGEGMTLLDYFAGKALCGYNADGSYSSSASLDKAVWSYSDAAAMLKERQKHL